MIIINKDADINKIGLTLRESQVVESNDFLFEFSNDLTGKVVTETLSDISINKSRMNVFSIAGSLFELPGFYHYTVYQTVNIDDEDVNIPIECGKLKVVEAENLSQRYTSQITETKVYNGQ